MKKATKIIIGITGGITAVALGAFGYMCKQAYDATLIAGLYGSPKPGIEENVRFQKYVGESKTGKDVKELIREIDIFNKTSYSWYIKYDGPEEDEIEDEVIYKVEIEGYANDGIITGFKVTRK